MIAWPGRIMIRPAEPRMRGSGPITSLAFLTFVGVRAARCLAHSEGVDDGDDAADDRPDGADDDDRGYGDAQVGAKRDQPEDDADDTENADTPTGALERTHQRHHADEDAEDAEHPYQ